MRGSPPCAYCRSRPADPAWRPFCSERCKLLDLDSWLEGSYRVPGDAVPADDERGGAGHEAEE